MSEPRIVPDSAQRERALDPQRSFIVQAPAGSGKTELLIQRYLVLLARVERPEEISAITFTKKAAAEMRKRIFEALTAARQTSRPAQAHRARTWDLARAALERNDELGWRLEENASRLRLQTIDALCASLTRQMPVLARFGAQPQSIEDASELYMEAARATLTLVEDAHDPVSVDVARLLVHLDNTVSQAQELLARMLRQRDHWSRHLQGADNRAALEAALASVRLEAIRKVRALLPEILPAPVPHDDDGPNGDAWVAFANQLLTKDGGWRKRHELYDELCENDPLCSALCRLQALPHERYTDDQWEALGAITRLLPRAVIELRVIFAARGQADFVEIAQGALRALEGEDGPTDLLLSLDYRLRHILIDEFQDTSFTQFALLEKLTSGWERGDGRTVFVVGDPMQSIYRFREAEVGLFLRAQHYGIGSVALEPLTLSANLRSQANIVSWVNEAFVKVMPEREDIAAGAVAYSPSEPMHAAQPAAVTLHPFFNVDTIGEARKVAQLAKAALAAPGLHPDKPSTTAILVRNRSHLTEIVPELKKAGLPFRAIEIEPLGARPVVQDLLALTRALSHLADRTAWLAVLRAPWCGLTLADLHTLAQGDRTLWECMNDPAVVSTMTADGRHRLNRIQTVLGVCLAERARSSLRASVEGAWLSLGGPACVEEATDLEDAEILLDYLEESEHAAAIPDMEAFQTGMAKLYALPDLEASERLQLMTIHKSKGLEFDTVIVPGLGAGTGNDERKLFLWMERANDLLLAPVNPTGSDKDRIYEHIRLLDKEKSDHENGRLLYVAATRARKSLHLLGDIKLDGDGAPKLPAKASLLAKLWPAVHASFAPDTQHSATEPNKSAAQRTSDEADELAHTALSIQLRRLPDTWTMPALPTAAQWTHRLEPVRTTEEVEFSWAGETARHIGTVVHRWLQRIAEEQLANWNPGRVAALSDKVAQQLRMRGVYEAQLPQATQRVTEALTAAIADPRGQWLLGPHQQSHSELRMTTWTAGRVRLSIVDRTFVDRDGTQWIVDFKTSTHQGKDVEAFLDREMQRYRAQLERYAQALILDPASPVRLGLYFPLLHGWREWEPQAGDTSHTLPQ